MSSKLDVLQGLSDAKSASGDGENTLARGPTSYFSSKPHILGLAAGRLLAADATLQLA